jgi:hypothetical protein
MCALSQYAGMIWLCQMPDDFQKRLADHLAIENRLKSELDEARIKHDCADQGFEEAAASHAS